MSQLLRRTSRTISYVAWIAVLYLMASITFDVLQRTFGIGLVTGLVEYNEIILVIMTYASLAYAQQTSAHVATDVVARFFPPRVRAGLEAVGLAIAVVVVLWITYKSFGAAVDSFERREFRFGLARVPIYPARMVIPIGLLALAFEIIADAVERARVALAAAPADVSEGTPSQPQL